ncbi:4Fe-4S binding protein [uncultured Oscillibacter sp.]|uniref:4Fe-4S binding protein n=1 Tax=uncultured Oscillibacter sp. TaxID=876091 RepID=UPI0025CE4B16|nr:4Fe-4S binding protein [uncultured Oscillibacter sp.]
MQVYSFLFSPTGGTEKVAALLEGPFRPVVRVDLSRRDTDLDAVRPEAGDLCLVSVPSYGGRVPPVAVERIGRLHGGGARTLIAVVYGNRAYEDTLLELRDTLSRQGFAVAAAVAAVAEHSIMHQFGAGRPDSRDAAELERFARQAKAALLDPGAKEPPLPGSRPYQAFGGLPLRPRANRRCTGCGLCARACPTGAIPAEAPASTDAAKCITCMRCVQLCPNGARSLPGLPLRLAAWKMKKACGGRKENELFL